MINNVYDTVQATAYCVCGGACEERLITLTLRRAANTFVLVRNVPADVCQECGETYFSLPTTGRMIATLHPQHAPDNLAVLPIYDYPASL